MELEIYLDVIFATNFMMNLFILYLTKKILRSETRKYGLFLGAAVGAVTYCIMLVYADYNMINRILLSVTMFIGPVLVSFKIRGVVQFLKNFIAVYIVSIIIGGAAFGLFYLVNMNNYLRAFMNIALYRFPIKLLILSVMFTFMILKFIVHVLNNYFINNKVYLVEVFKSGKSIIVKAIIDTGNSLREPLTLKPVVLIEKSLVDEFLGEKEIDKTYNIPFKSVGEEKGIIQGIECEKMKIYCEKEGDLLLENQIIGLYDGKFTVDGKYRMLLNSKLF